MKVHAMYITWLSLIVQMRNTGELAKLINVSVRTGKVHYCDSLRLISETQSKHLYFEMLNKACTCVWHVCCSSQI